MALNLVLSHRLIPRRLLRLMRPSHQVCGFLREVSPALDALPVLPRMHLSLQLQPSERRWLRRRQQRACRSPSESAAGITSLTPRTSSPLSHLSGRTLNFTASWLENLSAEAKSYCQAIEQVAFWERHLQILIQRSCLAKAKSKTLVVQNSC